MENLAVRNGLSETVLLSIFFWWAVFLWTQPFRYSYSPPPLPPRSSSFLQHEVDAPFQQLRPYNRPTYSRPTSGVTSHVADNMLQPSFSAPFLLVVKRQSLSRNNFATNMVRRLISRRGEECPRCFRKKETGPKLGLCDNENSYYPNNWLPLLRLTILSR